MLFHVGAHLTVNRYKYDKAYALVQSVLKTNLTTNTHSDCSLYCIFAQENFAAYCVSLWEIQMCFLAASECLQLCMTLLLASLHRVQTEKQRLRARLSALSLSSSPTFSAISPFCWSLSPLSLSFTLLLLLTLLHPSACHTSRFFLPCLLSSIAFHPSLSLSLPVLSHHLLRETRQSHHLSSDR